MPRCNVHNRESDAAQGGVSLIYRIAVCVLAPPEIPIDIYRTVSRIRNKLGLRYKNVLKTPRMPRSAIRVISRKTWSKGYLVSRRDVLILHACMMYSRQKSWSSTAGTFRIAKRHGPWVAGAL